MKSFRLSFALFVGLQICSQSCYYDNEQKLYHLTAVNCSTVSAKFTSDVMPIINLSCATPSCHNSAGAGGVILQNYDQVKAKIDRINQRVLISKTMPPSGALTPAEINILQCWINAGAPNN